MKKLEDLSIHPAPWKIGCKNYPPAGIVARDGSRVDRDMSDGDCFLIAFAPEMYECLRDAIDSYCYGCNDFIGRDQKCEPCECKARKWRAVLAKAAGEGAKIVNKVNRRGDKR